MNNETNHIFQRGDIISSGDKTDIRVILKAEDRIYYYMQIKSFYTNDIGGSVIAHEKGSEASQQADVVEKYFYCVNL